MRVALILTLLVGGLLVAAAWQYDEARLPDTDPAAGFDLGRDSFPGSRSPQASPEGPLSPTGPTHDGWDHLILGQPSGAAPLPGFGPTERRNGRQTTPRGPSRGAAREAIVGSTPTATSDEQPAARTLPGGSTPSFTYEIQPGDTLGQICSRFYTERGSHSLTAITEAVAHANNLPSPDALRAGQTLTLPPLGELFRH